MERKADTHTTLAAATGAAVPPPMPSDASARRSAPPRLARSPSGQIPTCRTALSPATRAAAGVTPAPPPTPPTSASIAPLGARVPELASQSAPMEPRGTNSAAGAKCAWRRTANTRASTGTGVRRRKRPRPPKRAGPFRWSGRAAGLEPASLARLYLEIHPTRTQNPASPGGRRGARIARHHMRARRTGGGARRGGQRTARGALSLPVRCDGSGPCPHPCIHGPDDYMRRSSRFNASRT